jgi:hypothetical protein
MQIFLSGRQETSLREMGVVRSIWIVLGLEA